MISRCLCQSPQLRVILWAGPSHPLGIARLAPKASLAATAAAAQETSGHSHDLFPLWYLTWNLLIDNACSLRKAHTVEEDYTESSTRIASGYRPQLWDFMLLSFYKAGGKLWVATSILYNTRDNSGMPFSELPAAWPHCSPQKVSAAKVWVSASLTSFFTEHQQEPVFFSRI